MQERRKRLERVETKAEIRQTRREGLVGRVQQQRPVPPEGMLARFQQKSHQQAVVAWEAAKQAALRLVEQAKQLAQRLRILASPGRLANWAYAAVKASWPEAMAEHESLVLEQERAKAKEAKEVHKAQETEPAARERAARSQGQGRLSTARRDEPPKQRSEPPRELRDNIAPAARPPAQITETARRWKELQQLEAERRLTVEERRELVHGFDVVLEGIAKGAVPAPDAVRQSLEIGRTQARRQLVAEVFLTMPAAEGIRRHPQLEDAYAFLEGRDAEMRDDGHGQGDVDAERLRVRRLLAQELVETGVMRTVQEHQQELARRRERGQEPER